MSIGTILLIILVLLLIGAIPSWPHSRSWGYGPSGGLGLLLLILVVLMVMGRIRERVRFEPVRGLQLFSAIDGLTVNRGRNY